VTTSNYVPIIRIKSAANKEYEGNSRIYVVPLNWVEVVIPDYCLGNHSVYCNISWALQGSKFGFGGSRE